MSINNAPLTFFQGSIVLFFIISIFNGLIIFPFVFHFFIIPKIQKRLGEKLKYTSPFYKLQIFAKWFYPPFDLSNAIVGQYLSWKIFGAPGKAYYRSKNSCSPFVLATNGYDVREASVFEIILAFLVWINMWGLLVLIITNLLSMLVR